MSRTAAKVTQADVARVMRAAKQVGMSGIIEVRPDGTIAFVAVDKPPTQDLHKAAKPRPVM